MRNESKIQWQPIVELIIVMMTILGTTIPLYLHTDSKVDKFAERMELTLNAIREDSRSFHREIQQEMKDFHGRLCAIEERRNK